MGREYRVTWQREGLRKKVRLFQTAGAARRHALVLQGRMTEAYPDVDPCALVCCPGTAFYECGCGGITFAEEWARRHARYPALIFGPVVASRTVGAWEPAA